MVFAAAASASADIEPSFPQYVRLKKLLATYEAYAADPLQPLPSLATHRTKIKSGDRYAGAGALRRELERLGDLAPSSAPGNDDRYSDELAEGVRRFQFRHGLLADGVLGKNTVAALNTPMATRVEQIRLSLERLRALPALPPGRLIAINIPSFQLVAFEDWQRDAAPALSMPVVVGKALQNETPVFVSEMTRVEFNPYWNVPASILRKEILPRLAKDPSYLEREDMEFVGDRLRQRPGPRNALGAIKFVLPNTMDIYLHATPATELFARTRRDFSHGCIRVREPVALAQFALRGDWTVPAIEAAMKAGTNRTVPLATPIPVVVFYTTALVDSEGRARFLPDIYGHDRKVRASTRG